MTSSGAPRTMRAERPSRRPSWIASALPWRFAQRDVRSRPVQGGGERNDADGAIRRSACRRPADVARGAASSPAPLAPQLGPVFQPLSDLAFKAALGRIVELLPAEPFRK